MNPINVVEVETSRGFGSFELFNADITEMGGGADVLIVSAFAGSYYPTPGTLVGSLYERCGIDLRTAPRDPRLNLTAPLGCWCTTPSDECVFRRILCVEIVGSQFDVNEALSNAFVAASLLELKGVEMRSLMLPVLGAGNQSIPPEEVISIVLPESIKLMERSSVLRRVLFVERNADKAAKLSDAMDEHLGRIKVVLPKGQLAESIRKDVLRVLDELIREPDLNDNIVLRDLKRMVSSEESRSFELGIAYRRAVELVVGSVLGASKTSSLCENIERLSTKKVAAWVKSYMHVLRVFGNESAHERKSEGRLPATIEPSDLALSLVCVLRVLEFFQQWRSNQS